MEYQIFIYEIDKELLEDSLIEEAFGFEILEKKENLWKISTDKKIDGIEPIEIKKINYDEFEFGEIEPIKEDIFVIVPSYAIPIKIKKGMAFGTGLHESTKLMLSLMKDFIGAYDSVLDVGCGSGILTIASKYLSKSYVKGIDIDPIAIQEAIENAKNNRIEDIHFEVASPEDILIRRFEYSSKKLKHIKDEFFYDYFIGVYDVVLANLEMHIFEKELPNIAKLFKKYLTISGIYKDEDKLIKDMINNLHLKILKQTTKNDWHGFVVKHVEMENNSNLDTKIDFTRKC
ncbi:ribosomal L11 methyltransferase [Hydrogenobaculum sp. Y04AAS1]|uniref:50S ribosomal protein L11 methyltransferase n=1 Tax=Hydrogenobaculum sp. (strain Y04AAS1) TaxID=380749 RepID=UPI00015BC94B|nr:ribosomal L11 methyltransferase [Hydrogenobaculum sp. Y04AAS1]HCT66755.1 methyltransferase domain-containing protein [Hydrogenobaculum sp.]